MIEINKNLNSYYITSKHDIYIDNYTEGEGERVNSYDMNAIIKADNVKEAIAKYFKNELYLSYDEEYIDDSLEDGNFFYSNLVDSENLEATKNEIESWQKNEKILYSNNTTISIFQLVKIEKL